jgi:hypothetical protein
MRYSFGGDLASWAYAVTGSVIAPATSVQVTFWNNQSGGSQYTDLSLSPDGLTPTIAVTTSDGSDGRAPGSIPQFWGPDGIAVMWAAIGANPRQLIVSNDVPVLAGGAQTITGQKTFDTGDSNATRIIIKANASGQAADLMQAWSSADVGQGGASQRTFYLNEKGELRAICAASNSVGFRLKGQPGQTQHIMEVTDTGNNVLAWVEPNGSIRAPNLAHILALSISGALTVGVGAHRIYNDTGVQLTIRNIRATVGTAPAGASVIVDVNKNGTTLFTTQSNRPTIAAGTNTIKRTNMDVTTINDGEYITVDVDQIGSTTAGSDLVVQLLAY